MLNKIKLKQDLKKDIKNIQKDLYDDLNDKSKGIYDLHKRLSEKMTDMIPNSEFDIDEYNDKVWTIISEEWSKTLSERIINTLSEKLSEIISDRMTSYIKSATITVPPGQATSTTTPAGALPGVTSSISPKANIN